MKRKNITLPTLQVAATAFLAGSANAAPYCVEKSTSKVVATHACPLSRDAADYSTVEGPSGSDVGSVVRRDDDMGDDEQELAEATEKALKVLKLVAGGFGGRECDPNRVCSLFGGTPGPGFGHGGHWGGGGFVAIGGGGGGSGGRPRGSGSRGG